MMRRSTALKSLTWLMLCAAASGAGSQGTIHYTYDKLGRLDTALGPDGVALFYRYDAVGNITSITQLGPNLTFTPSDPSGFQGDTVQLTGVGFSTVPTENVVTLNGTPLTVEAASRFELIVRIPAAAQLGDGVITVKRGTQQASQPFAVVEALPVTLAALAVKGNGTLTLTPTSGTFGTGTPVVELSNGTAVPVVAFGPNQMTLQFPAQFAASPLTIKIGKRVYLSPRVGQLPASAPDQPGNVKQIVTLQPNTAPPVVSVPAASLALLEVQLDARTPAIFSVVPQAGSGSGKYTIYDAAGAVVATQSFTTGQPTKLEFPVSTQDTQRYTVLLEAQTGTLSTAVGAFSEKTVTVNKGQLVDLNTQWPGQELTVVLREPELGALNTNFQTLTTQTGGALQVRDFDGQLKSVNVGSSSVFTRTYGSSTYRLKIVPAANDTFSTKLAVTGSKTVTVTPETATTFSTDFPGQRLAFQLQGVNPGNQYVSLSGLALQGEGLQAQFNSFRGSGLSVPAGTTNLLEAIPAEQATAELYAPVATRLTGTLNVKGPQEKAVTRDAVIDFATAFPGQAIRLNLSGAVPGPLQLSLSGVNLTGAAATANLKTFGGATTYLDSGASTILDYLPSAAGQAVLTTSDEGGAAGRLTLTGTATSTYTLGTAPAITSTQFPTQWLQTSFNSTGQPFGVTLTNLTHTSSSQQNIVSVESPAGATGFQFGPSQAGTYIGAVTVQNPGTGLVKVTVKPANNAGNTSSRLQIGPSTPLALGTYQTITANKDSVAFAHFNVAPADDLQIMLRNLTFTPAGSGKVTLVYPNGYYMSTGTASNLVLKAKGAEQAGLYTLLVQPPAGATTSLQAALERVAPPVADLQPVNLTSSATGASVSQTFTGSSATPKRLFVNGLSFGGSSGQIQLIYPKPDANGYSSSTVTLPSSFTSWSSAPLNLDGVYTVVFIPSSTTSAKARLQVVPVTAATNLDVSRTLTSGSVMKGAAFSFNGTQGQSVDLSLTGMTFAPAATATTPATLQLFGAGANATALGSATTTGASGTNQLVLGTAGVYTAVYWPPTDTTSSQGTVAVKSSAVNNVPTTTVTVNAAATTISTTTAGAQRKIAFNATAGQNLTVRFSSVAFNPTTGTATVKFIHPNGSTLGTTTLKHATGFNMQLPNVSAGTYTMLVTVSSTAKTTFKIQVTNP
jgi:hypothetical protein